jgi:hypothetical protein
MFSVFSFGCFPGVWFILADVSKHSICSTFKAADFEDGRDRMFRNVSQYKPGAGETPKRKHTEYWTRWKFKIKKAMYFLITDQYLWPTWTVSGLQYNLKFCVWVIHTIVLRAVCAMAGDVAYCSGGRGSNAGQSGWDLWWTEWYFNFSKDFGSLFFMLGWPASRIV